MRELTCSEVVTVAGGLETTTGLDDSIAGLVVGAAGGTAWGASIGGSAGGNGGGVFGIGSIAQGVGMLAGGAYGFVSGAVIGGVLGYDSINNSGAVDYVFDALTGGAVDTDLA